MINFIKKTLNINKDNLDGAQMEVNLKNLKKDQPDDHQHHQPDYHHHHIIIIVIIITIINLIIPPTTSRECTSIVQIVIT